MISSCTSGYLAKENKNTNSESRLHPCVPSSVIYIGRDTGTAQVSTNRWMVRKMCVYTILLGHKNETLPLATVWVDLEGIMPRETSQRNSNVRNLNRQTTEKQTAQTQRWWPEGETGEGDEEGQTCSEKISMSRGRTVQHGERGWWSSSNSVWCPVVTALLQIILGSAKYWITRRWPRNR